MKYEMNAFVCGDVKDVRNLANALLNAADTVEYVIYGEGDGTDARIEYNSAGKIVITYKPTDKPNHLEEDEETEESKEDDKKKDDSTISMDELEEICGNVLDDKPDDFAFI